MALSIAQMRESGHIGLPERTIRMCLAQKLVAEVESLTFEKTSLQPERDENGDQKGPRRNADPNAARIAEIDERLRVLVDEMREHTGELRIRAVTAGEWRRWADEHPARIRVEESSVGPVVDPIDMNVAKGWVNASALLDSLDAYVVAWNDSPLGPGDWEWISSNAAPGDLAEACRQVVDLHVEGGMVPKSLTLSSTTPSVESD